jgi:hypothetical protein
MHSVAIYSVANEGYVAKAVLALISFQRWHPDFGYFLLGTKSELSSESKQLLRRYNIELIDIDEARSFVKQGRCKDNYPVEVFYPLKGPEFLAERGFQYSIGIDGDVFAPQPFNISKLEYVLNRTTAYAARPVGTLARTLVNKRAEQNREFNFSAQLVAEVLGIKSNNVFGMKSRAITRRFEPQAGVIYWNNLAMAKLGLFGKCVHLFQQCNGCFEADQDLLAFATAIHEMDVLQIGHPYNFGFFEDSEWVDRKLQKRLRRGEYEDVHVVHFVFSKPWLPLEKSTPVKVYYVNMWRKFAREEFGLEGAVKFFGESSTITL